MPFFFFFKGTTTTAAVFLASGAVLLLLYVHVHGMQGGNKTFLHPHLKVTDGWVNVWVGGCMDVGG